MVHPSIGLCIVSTYSTFARKKETSHRDVSFFLAWIWDSKERPNRRAGKKVSGGHFFSSWENPGLFDGIPRGVSKQAIGSHPVFIKAGYLFFVAMELGSDKYIRTVPTRYAQNRKNEEQLELLQFPLFQDFSSVGLSQYFASDFFLNRFSILELSILCQLRRRIILKYT